MPIAAVWVLLLLYYNRPTGTVNRAQDDCWKFGLYYFNPRDAAWIVPARLGAGATLNFARPLAWILILISASGLGLRCYVRSSAPIDNPDHFVESQFAIATLQLRGGKFEASEQLMRIARHSDDPAIWSSAAYELTDNHVKPHFALEWAERAAASGESVSAQARLTMTTNEDWKVMARLAAYWSNLGYVCSWQGDFDCAQRYLAATWTLDPLPGYRDELVELIKSAPRSPDRILATLKLQSGAPVRQVVNISLQGSNAGTAYFDVLLSEKEPTKIVWSRGDRNLSGAAESIARNLAFPWPDDGGSEKVRFREKLTCTGFDSACELMALSPEEAVTVRPNLPR